MGSLVPPTGMPESCSQIFILDEAMQVQARMGQRWASGLDASVVLRLGSMLQRVNEFVHHFRAAAADVRANAYMRIANNPAADRRRYNRPTVASDIAVFIPDGLPSNVQGLQQKLSHLKSFFGDTKGNTQSSPLQPLPPTHGK